MYSFTFTKYSEKQFLKLDIKIRERIVKKLTYFKNPENIKNHLKIVQNLQPATHRIRIGEYRLLIEIDDAEITIYKVAHRKEVYK